MQINTSYFSIILGFLVVISLTSSSYALETDTIKMPLAKVTPTIDGKFTSENEWSDAKTVRFQSNGHDFYMQVKHDPDYVYFMFDAVDFRADPKDDSTSVRYQGLVCLDTEGDRTTTLQAGDYCFVQTAFNEFGRLVRTENAELKYAEGVESENNEMVHNYQSEWGFGSENDKFEGARDHLTYELKVLKKSFPLSDDFGLNFRMYFGSAHDDLVQLTDGVAWPLTSDKDNPSTWGIMASTTSSNLIVSPLQQFKSGIPIDEIQCEEGLQLVIKSSNGNPACVKQEAIQKLIERGWAKPDLRVLH